MTCLLGLRDQLRSRNLPVGSWPVRPLGVAMSRQLGRAHVGTGTSRADMVSGCVNGRIRLHTLLVSDCVSGEGCVHGCVIHGGGSGWCIPGVGGLYVCVPAVKPSL